MTWAPDKDTGNESSKVRWAVVPYTRGRGLDLGAGQEKTFPHFISVDNNHHQKFGYVIKPDVLVKTCEDLSVFADASMDFIFSSHLLEHIEDHAGALKEWWRLVRPGGHMVLYLPHRDLYPQIADDGEYARAIESKCKRLGRDPDKLEAFQVIQLIAANRKARGVQTIGAQYAGTGTGNGDHKHDFSPDDIVEAMRGLDGWDLLVNESRDQDDEYSFLQIYRKLDAIPAAWNPPRSVGDADWSHHKPSSDAAHALLDNRQRESWRLPKPEKTVGICRYGAFGDVIMASSVAAGLKQQGYHVTMMGSPPGIDVMLHDPNVDAFLLQDKDQVPNQNLGEHWAYWSKRFDKWVQLSGSVEDVLLATPGRPNHGWPHSLRHRMLNHNYIEFAHRIAEIPYTESLARFYASPEEKVWARLERERMGDFAILWSLAGSSLHKTWDGLDAILARIMIEYPAAHVVLVGGPECRMLEAGWEDEPRVHGTCGVWSIRQSMAFLEQADLVIGPETGVLNAASMMALPKVCFLSHSSVENLTRDWRNTTSLTSKTTPCYPCHQLHLNSDGWGKHCPRTDRLGPDGERRGVAHCQGEIEPSEVWDVVRSILDKAREQREEAA